MDRPSSLVFVRWVVAFSGRGRDMESPDGRLLRRASPPAGRTQLQLRADILAEDAAESRFVPGTPQARLVCWDTESAFGARMPRFWSLANPIELFGNPLFKTCESA